MSACMHTLLNNTALLALFLFSWVVQHLKILDIRLIVDVNVTEEVHM